MGKSVLWWSIRWRVVTPVHSSMPKSRPTNVTSIVSTKYAFTATQKDGRVLPTLRRLLRMPPNVHLSHPFLILIRLPLNLIRPLLLLPLRQPTLLLLLLLRRSRSEKIRRRRSPQTPPPSPSPHPASASSPPAPHHRQPPSSISLMPKMPLKQLPLLQQAGLGSHPASGPYPDSKAELVWAVTCAAGTRRP